MNETAARRMADDWMEKQGLSAKFEITQVDEHGGVFLAFWGRKDGAEIAGNAPLLIDVPRLFITATGTAHQMEYYLENYHVTGDPHTEPVKRVRISASTAAPDKVAALATLKDLTPLGLAESKKALDAVLSGRSLLVSPREQPEAGELAARLRGSGLAAEIELCKPDGR